METEKLIRAAYLADEGNDLARTMNKKAMFAVDIEPQADVSDLIYYALPTYLIDCINRVNSR